MSVEVGERSETMSAVKFRLVSWGQSGCTDLIAARLSWLVPGASLHGASLAGALSYGTGTEVQIGTDQRHGGQQEERFGAEGGT